MERIGGSVARVDGPDKVTGRARYVGDLAVPLHAALVRATIPRGRMRAIDDAPARTLDGVVDVVTFANAERLNAVAIALGPGRLQNTAGESRLPLQDDEIRYAGQALALVVATSVEVARHAATLVRVDAEPAPFSTDMDAPGALDEPPENHWEDPAEHTRGEPARALAASDVRVDVTYRTRVQHHVTMEPHATVARWDGETLAVDEPTTYVYGARATLAKAFGLPPERVRVRNAFVGGSFGAKGPIWPHVFLVAMAARRLARPVKLVLSRRETFTSNAHRPALEQRFRFGANRDAAISAFVHDARTHSSSFDLRVVAPVTKTPRKLYAFPNAMSTYRMVRLDLPGPFTMRGPGEMPGVHALECALDEAAEALNVDPLELRRRNVASIDPDHRRPWSSNALLRCYDEGARRIGWERRAAPPRSLRDGRALIGLGMATMAYDSAVSPAHARAELHEDGSVVVRSATCDQGTGSYTVYRQIAAETLGIPFERVRFELGDTDFPQAPISAGSRTLGSVGPAVADACRKLRASLDAGALAPLAAEGVGGGERDERFTYYSFGAHFTEVAVDADTGEVRVRRHVAVMDAGRRINERLARSQVEGGVVWGLSMALHEGTELDHRFGTFMNCDLAEYHVSTNADVPPIEVVFVDEDDPYVNPLRAKAIGEIGNVGSSASVVNAVYHATGIRVRDLPLTPDKLLR
ncbi:MAG TPA: xanthine dehydrogenase family protein molybdopterin-binding subunit [Candidatus Baltobacteraceae bacterium]|nr:xanthine dehydrogenase family protein molybdopterin-binding subunit [Candidatus Baltobacteraceae bacterium]